MTDLKSWLAGYLTCLAAPMIVKKRYDGVALILRVNDQHLPRTLEVPIPITSVTVT